MLESTSMVSGALPGPAPADHARLNSSPATLSKLRASAQLKLRKKVPIVEGARTAWPNTAAVAPERNTSQSSMLSAPTRTAWTTVIALWPTFARPGASPRSTRSSISSRNPRC